MESAHIMLCCVWIAGIGEDGCMSEGLCPLEGMLRGNANHRDSITPCQDREDELS